MNALWNKNVVARLKATYLFPVNMLRSQHDYYCECNTNYIKHKQTSCNRSKITKILTAGQLSDLLDEKSNISWIIIEYM